MSAGDKGELEGFTVINANTKALRQEHACRGDTKKRKESLSKSEG